MSQQTPTIDPALKGALGEIKEAFTEAERSLKEHLDTQAEEIRSLGGTTKETADKIKTAEETLGRIGDDLKALQTRVDEIEKSGQRPGLGGAEDVKSLGERFVQSDQYKSYIG